MAKLLYQSPTAKVSNVINITADTVKYPVVNESFDARKYSALLYINDELKNERHGFTMEQIREIIKRITGASDVMIVYDENPGCFKSTQSIKDVYVDRDGQRFNFRQMMDEYSFFTATLGLTI